MSTTIRQMIKKDRKEVVDMMRIFYSSPAVLSDGSEQIFDQDFNHCVDECPYLEGYMFEDETGIQGYAMVAKTFSTEFGCTCMFIEDLYVKDGFRGVGIGSQFLRFVENKYPDSILKLEVEDDNDRAINVYKKNGMEVLPYTEMIKKR